MAISTKKNNNMVFNVLSASTGEICSLIDRNATNQQRHQHPLSVPEGGVQDHPFGESEEH